MNQLPTSRFWVPNSMFQVEHLQQSTVEQADSIQGVAPTVFFCRFINHSKYRCHKPYLRELQTNLADYGVLPCTIKICLFWGGGRLKHIQVCQGLPRSNAWDLKICSTTLCVLFLEIPFTVWWCVWSHGKAECMDMFWWNMTFETTLYLIQALTISGTIRSVLNKQVQLRWWLITSEPLLHQQKSIQPWTALRLYPYFNTAALVKRFFKLYERCVAREQEGKMKPGGNCHPNRFKANRVGELVHLVKWWPQPIDYRIL